MDNDRDITFYIVIGHLREAILRFQNFQNVCHFDNGCHTRHKIWAVKIQHFPISSKFDMWVDNDVSN